MSRQSRTAWRRWLSSKCFSRTSNLSSCQNSYGYRPGKSALDAIAVTRERCWRYDWVLEFDVKGLFDNIDHTLLLRALEKHTACALIEQVRETRLVLPAAQFALTEQESSDFAKKVSYYAYEDEAEGDEGGDKTVDPSTTPEDADLDHDDGDVEQIAAPEIEAADHADTGYEARD